MHVSVKQFETPLPLFLYKAMLLDFCPCYGKFTALNPVNFSWHGPYWLMYTGTNYMVHQCKMHISPYEQ